MASVLERISSSDCAETQTSAIRAAQWAQALQYKAGFEGYHELLMKERSDDSSRKFRCCLFWHRTSTQPLGLTEHMQMNFLSYRLWHNQLMVVHGSVWRFRSWFSSRAFVLFCFWSPRSLLTPVLPDKDLRG